MKWTRFAWLLPFVALAVWSLLPRLAPGSPTERQAVVGTWVERRGEPGNFVRLEWVKVQSSALVEVLEGVAIFSRQFGFDGAVKATWNVEH